MEENKEKKTVASYVQDLEEYCRKKGIPIPRRVEAKPMVIIPSKALEEELKQRHNKQRS